MYFEIKLINRGEVLDIVYSPGREYSKHYYDKDYTFKGGAVLVGWEFRPIIDDMPHDKLGWAFEQIRREKKNNIIK